MTITTRKSRHPLGLCILIALLLTACSGRLKTQQPHNDKFEPEINSLINTLSIPGVAVLVKADNQNLYEKYLGYADIENDIMVSAETIFPIASITKVFSAVLIFRLEEQGLISLNDAANKYLPNNTLDDGILIKHIISHTSERNPGQFFHYSARFSLLTQIIEQASGMSFKDYLTQEIILPLRLTHTNFLIDDSSYGADNMAQPYNYGNPPEPGNKEPGFSASAGLTTTTDNLGLFFDALFNHQLIPKKSLNMMMKPHVKNSPYGMGMFTDTVWGEPINWAYGQYDSYASLFIYVPKKKLSLLVLTNNNLISDSARLINGDIKSSLLAMAFLENFVFNEAPNTFELHRNLAQAQLLAFMARYDLAHLKESKQILGDFFKQNTSLEDFATLNLLHTLVFLKDVHHYLELGPFNEFDGPIKRIAKKLIQQDRNNPYLNIYLASFHLRNQQLAEAKFYYQNIVKLSNSVPNWYTREAELFLSENP